MITEASQLRDIRQQYADKKISFAGGVFDIIHPGHIEYLKYIKSLADIAIIAVSSDARVRERKGPCRPINNEQARLTVIDSIRYVDYSLIAPSRIIQEPGLAPTVYLLQQLQPDYFVTQDSRWYDYADSITECGTELVFDPTPKVNSTTDIVKVILDSYTPTIEG